MNQFTPLTPIAKSVSSSTSSATPLTNTSSLASLPTLAPVTPVKSVSSNLPVLEKTTKGVPKANTAPTSVSEAPVVGINPPALEKVTKAPKTAPKGSSSLPPNLRPSWPTEPEKKAEVKTPTLEVSPKTKPAAQQSQPGVRVENPNGLYIVTCDVHTMGCDSVTTGITGRKILHGIYSYPEVMAMAGETVTGKLIGMVKKNMLNSFPPFMVAGITLGTIIVEVTHPTYDVTGDIVADIEMKSSDGKHRYRTIRIKRFRRNTFTSLVM